MANLFSDDVTVLGNDGSGDSSMVAGPFTVGTSPSSVIAGDVDLTTANVDSGDVSVPLNTLNRDNAKMQGAPCAPISLHAFTGIEAWPQ